MTADGEQPDFIRDKAVVTGRQEFGENLADAVSSIQGQLDQLIAELVEMAATPQAERAKSIRNALAQIAPEAAE